MYNGGVNPKEGLARAEVEVGVAFGFDEVVHPMGCISILPHDWHIHVTRPPPLPLEYDSGENGPTPPAERPAVGSESDGLPGPGATAGVSYSGDVDHPRDVFMSIRRMCLSEDPETIYGDLKSIDAILK